MLPFRHGRQGRQVRDEPSLGNYALLETSQVSVLVGANVRTTTLIAEPQEFTNCPSLTLSIAVRSLGKVRRLLVADGRSRVFADISCEVAIIPYLMCRAIPR